MISLADVDNYMVSLTSGTDYLPWKESGRMIVLAGNIDADIFGNRIDDCFGGRQKCLMFLWRAEEQ